MIKLVEKRDGKVVPFDRSRVENAIQAAMLRTEAGVDIELVHRIADSVENTYKDKISVIEIQDLVEKKLMSSKRKDAARAYIKYRQKRDVARQSKTRVMFEEIINTKANDVTRENANMNSDTPAGMMMKFASETTKPFVDNYLLCDDVKEAVQDNYIHIHDKDYYPTKSLTCLQHPLDVIFKKGFRAGHGELRPPKRIETAATQACVSMETIQNEMHGGQAIPAFDFYLAPFVRMAYQEEIDKIRDVLDGGIIPHVEREKFWENLKNAEIKDYLVKEQDAPGCIPAAGTYYPTYSDPERIKQIAINRTVDRVHQALEAFVHNMNNIHSRGGNQVVFSSINYGTDTSAEGRCIIREILKTTEKGVGNGATAIFPIQIWKMKSGVSYLPGDPNYDLFQYACKVTARRFFPNFLNLDVPFNQHPKWDINDPERYKWEVATMGCRTRIFTDKYGETTSIGRGNLSFTTLNLPKMAIEAAIEAGVLEKTEGYYHDSGTRQMAGQSGRFQLNGYISIFDPEYADKMGKNLTEAQKQKLSKKAIKLFWEKYEKYLALAAKQLDQRYQFQATAKAKQFPLLMSGMWMGSENLKPDDTIEPVLKHGTLAIGFIGLAEALKALTGKHHGEDPKAQELGLEFIKYLDKRCKDFGNQYDHNYTAFATPAEGLSGKFTAVDRKEFGYIKGVLDKDYYTNSNHVPTEYPCTPKEKMEIEAAYHPYTPAGHIGYLEIDYDTVKNPEAIEDLVRIMHDAGIGYGSINHVVTRCIDCGYEGHEESFDVCPKCGSTNLTDIQRITGYLVGTTDRWNHGKQAELKNRVVHTGTEHNFIKVKGC
jgi:ribonucleoside-triphosphate reductase